MPERSIEELQEKVGTERVTVQDLTVEAGKVTEFADALRDDNPVYREGEAEIEGGTNRQLAPPTFTQVERFDHFQPDDREPGIQGFDLGFDPERTVHGEQEYVFERPVEVGDTLTGTTTLTDVYQRDGEDGPLTFAVLTTEYRTESGELVVTEKRTAIET